MNKTQLRNIATGLYTSMGKNMQEIRRGNGKEKEPVHHFRVAYKKLRAFMRMISASRSGVLPRELKLLYAAAGRLRDQQLLLDTLLVHKKKIALPSSLLLSLKRTIRKDQQYLRTLLAEYDNTGVRDKLLRIVPPQFSLRDFQQYAVAKRNEVNAFIQRRMYRDVQVHHIRKCLKDLYYNTAVYKGVVQQHVFATAWKGASDQQIGSLLNGLGKFQDSCTAISLLSRQMNSQFTAAEKQQLFQLRKKWLNEKRLQKKELTRLLPVLFHD